MDGKTTLIITKPDMLTLYNRNLLSKKGKGIINYSILLES